MKVCTCIARLESEIKEQKYKGKSIESVEFENKGMVMKDNKLGILVFSTFTATLNGQKKKQEFKVFNSFCQFCGQKLFEDDTANTCA
jgi:hypothetical protein